MKDIRKRCERVRGEVFNHIPGLDPDIKVIKVNVQVDHVHMVVISPRYVVARVVQYIKSQSGKALRERSPFLGKEYFSRGGIGSRGYCVSGIGMDEKEILSYVEHQEKEDRGQLPLPF